MTRVWQWIIRIASTIVALAILGGSLFYFGYLRPRAVLRALYEKEYAGELVTEDQFRQAAHAALRFFPDHDAFVTLMRHGDESSIPILIKSIGRVSQPDEDGIVICTSGHCRDALERITGVDFGYNVSAWKQWANGKKTEPATAPEPPPTAAIQEPTEIMNLKTESDTSADSGGR